METEKLYLLTYINRLVGPLLTCHIQNGVTRRSTVSRYRIKIKFNQQAVEYMFVYGFKSSFIQSSVFGVSATAR